MSTTPQNDNNFNNTAISLAKNPLGIIALFIVLVYSFASLIIILGDGLEKFEKIMYGIFLVTFPLVVLGTFYRLVIYHFDKLFSPGDYKNEENFIKMRMFVATSLAAAVKSTDSTPQVVKDIVDSALKINTKNIKDNPNRSILWVDDNPNNNINETRAFKTVGIKVTSVLSTSQALQALEQDTYSVIISDMGRKEGSQEGYVLLNKIRERGLKTPFFIYASSNSSEHKQQIKQQGGNDSTNNPRELFDMVMKVIDKT